MKKEINSLEVIGWNHHFQRGFEAHEREACIAGRVCQEFGESYHVWTVHGELTAYISGKLRFEAGSREELPAVGDWTVIHPLLDEGKAVIQQVLPRRSQFVRKASGSRTEAQVVGANVDTVFLITALNQDFNLRRIERYLVLAWNSGATPVVVLSKSDLCQELDQRILDVERVACGVP
ncbi:MAG: GTPase RsgA, partial [Blastocatellia bacterium]